MRTELTDQLHLAAKILEEDLPWERQLSTGVWGTTDSAIVTILSGGMPIRIKPTPTLTPLEASDIPPGSVISVCPDLAWFSLVWVGTSQVNYMSAGKMATLTVGELHSEGWKINRSIPLLGNWDPTAWEPCSKQSTY